MILCNQDDVAQTEAGKHFNKALEIYKKLNSWNDVAKQYCNLGFLYSSQRKFDLARESWKQALDMFRHMGNSNKVEDISGLLSDLPESN